MDPKETTIPKTITVGEQEIPTSDPSVQNLIHIAGSIEKSKLYSTIETKNEELKRLSAEIATLRGNKPSETQNAPTHTPNLTQIADKMRDDQRQIANNQADITADMIRNTVENALSSLLPKVLAPVQEQLQNIQSERLNDYRNRRIHELQGKIIPELIKGNTMEEIEASITESMSIAAKYLTGSAPAPAQQTQVQVQPVSTDKPTQQVVQPVSGQTVNPDIQALPITPTPNSGNTLLSTVKGMSDAEFAKDRDNLQKELKSYASEYATLNPAQP